MSSYIPFRLDRAIAARRREEDAQVKEAAAKMMRERIEEDQQQRKVYAALVSAQMDAWFDDPRRCDPSPMFNSYWVTNEFTQALHAKAEDRGFFVVWKDVADRDGDRVNSIVSVYQTNPTPKCDS